LLQALLRKKQFTEIVGVDASVRALEIASQRLKLERLAPRQRARIQLLHGSVTYRDARLADYDAAAVVEVVEHLDLGRLAAFERVLFGHGRPGTVLVTTPNREHNATFPDFEPGRLRHKDHRFEWTREEFSAWGDRVAAAYGYQVEYRPIGAADAHLGPPTQMAVFARCS
jgi:3' terminal RNA ribose 2'-O-methyltransferase Hen1